MVQDVKPKTAVKSSQNWANVVMPALVGIFGLFWPAAADFITLHPVVVTGSIGLINILWRTFVTKQPIEGII